MTTFLNPEQQALVEEIAALLIERHETVAVAEATSGGLISAALLSVAGASRYYAGGGVVYTLKSRTELAGVSAEEYANYRGTTPEMLGSLAGSMRQRLGATWAIAESGMAGPTGSRFGVPPGRTIVSIAGPVARTEVVETGLDDRGTNMVEFTTHGLRILRDAIKAAPSA